jgi:fucose permease
MIGRVELIAVTIAAAFVVGMVLAILGSIKLPLAQRLAIDEARVGGLLSAMAVALIPMMLLCGILIDLLGAEWVLIGGSFLAAGALAALALCRSYWAAFGALLLGGAAIACLSNSGSVLMPRAFYPDNKAAAMNLGNVFFGLGALVTPALAEVLIGRLQFRKALGVMALVGLIPALAAAFTPTAAFALDRQHGDLGAVLLNPLVWLTGLAFFLYMPLESTLGAWATTILTEAGQSVRVSSWLLSGFWLAFLAARLGDALLNLPAGWSPWVILGLALSAAVVMGNLAGAEQGRASAAFGLLLIGLLFGPIFPTLVGILFEKVPEGQRGTAFGAMFAIGAAGNLVVPPLFGVYARRHKVQRSLWLTMVVSLLLAAAALLLGLWLMENRLAHAAP